MDGAGGVELIRIAIADDHPIMRLGLTALLEKEEGLTVVGSAANGEELQSLLKTQLTDVVVLDIEMPLMNGIEISRYLKASYPEVKIVIFTAHNESAILRHTLHEGVHGLVSKENVYDELFRAIRKVAKGERYISAVFSDFLIGEIDDERSRNKLLELLTATELKVLGLIAQSKTSAEIASELLVSLKTVENHRGNMCKKLELKGKNSLLKFAIAHKGLLLKNI
jgi:DNA-binding NarL/FixJ family response regulator